jgi:hypothetical protein
MNQPVSVGILVAILGTLSLITLPLLFWIGWRIFKEK